MYINHLCDYVTIINDCKVGIQGEYLANMYLTKVIPKNR